MSMINTWDRLMEFFVWSLFHLLILLLKKEVEQVLAWNGFETFPRTFILRDKRSRG